MRSKHGARSRLAIINTRIQNVPFPPLLLITAIRYMHGILHGVEALGLVSDTIRHLTDRQTASSET